MLSYSTTLKNEVDYYPLPNGTVDVFLRKRLPDEVDGEGNETFVYDEVSINTTLPREIVEEYFDLLFEDPTSLDVVTPAEPSEADGLMLAIAELDAQREIDKTETEMAIAELAEALTGGV